MVVQDLLVKTGQFLRRHRRIISLGVGIGVAGYTAYKIKRWRDEYYKMIRELEEARFDQHRWVGVVIRFFTRHALCGL